MIFEAGFLPRLSSRRSVYGDFSTPRQRWYFIRDIQDEKATSETFAFEKFENLSDQEAEAAIREVAPTDYPGAASAIYAAAAQKENKSRWGEKMPRYITQIEWLASTFPDSHIVHILRDPRDVAASICRAGWEGSLRRAAQRWKTTVSEGRRQARSVEDERYHEVKYETLLQNPTETTKRLARRLDIAFDSEMVKGTPGNIPDSHREAHPDLFSKLDQPIDPSRAYAWKREMSPSEVADVESVAAPLMKELGYDITGAKPPIAVQGVRWCKDKAVPLARKLKPLARKVRRAIQSI